MMELYEKFHSLKQRGMTVEEYTSEFNNLSIQVGLNETNEQMTSHYLSVKGESLVVRRVMTTPKFEEEAQYFLHACVFWW